MYNQQLIKMNPFRASSSRQLPAQATIDDPTDNRCFNLMHVSLTLLHFLEFMFGLSLIGYAIAISMHQPDPQHGFAVILQLWSMLLLVASISGTIGLAKDEDYNCCKRIPLKLSGWMSPVKAVVYCLFLIILLVQKQSLYNYFREKHDALYLSMGIIDWMNANVRILNLSFCLLIFVELARFSLIRTIRDDLCLYDDANQQGLLRNTRRHSNRRQRNNNNNNNNDDENNNDLSAPLISSDDDNNANNDNFSGSGNNTSWWEDGDEDGDEDEASIEEIPHENKGFFSQLSWRSSSMNSSKDNPNPASSKQIENDSSIDSGDLFAPIDEQLQFEEPTADVRMVHAESNNNSGYTSTPSWLEEGGTTQTVGKPDLSWSKGEEE